jgi:hypothetical protein
MSMATKPIFAFWYWRATGDETGELGKTVGGRQQQGLQCSHLRSGTDVGQVPHCYIGPSAKLAVKSTKWWLRPNLNGAP